MVNPRTRHGCRIQKMLEDCIKNARDTAGIRGSEKLRFGQRCLDRLRLRPKATARRHNSTLSIDLIDGYHPQTILAYQMNDATLPVAHGAPLRLRVERQLGYKQAKYISRIEAVSDFKDMGRGKGGYWEDRGYEWYAGI